MKRILLFTMMAVATMAATAQEATVNVDTIRLENAFTDYSLQNAKENLLNNNSQINPK